MQCILILFTGCYCVVPVPLPTIFIFPNPSTSTSMFLKNHYYFWWPSGFISAAYRSMEGLTSGSVATLPVGIPLRNTFFSLLPAMINSISNHREGQALPVGPFSFHDRMLTGPAARSCLEVCIPRHSCSFL